MLVSCLSKIDNKEATKFLLSHLLADEKYTQTFVDQFKDIKDEEYLNLLKKLEKTQYLEFLKKIENHPKWTQEIKKLFEDHIEIIKKSE